MPLGVARLCPEALEALAVSRLHHDCRAGRLATALRPGQPHQVRFQSALYETEIVFIATAQLRAGLHQMEIAELRAAVGAGDVLDRRAGQRLAISMKVHDLAVIGIATIAFDDKLDPAPRAGRRKALTVRHLQYRGCERLEAIGRG